MPDEDADEPDAREPAHAATGVDGLDQILGGGLPRGELHVVRGGPGTGKTTLGLQFLLAGAARGERVAFVSLSQTRRALETIAASHGWSLRGVEVRERAAILGAREEPEQTLFRTADVELGETVSGLLSEIGRIAPDRVVIDSIEQIRLLADTGPRYHRQLLALRDFLSERAATVLVSDGQARGDDALSDLSHGTIALERNIPDYGNVRRRLHIAKMRGVAFHGGNHNFRIRTGGLDVFPSLEPGDLEGREVGPALESGSGELDALLGGGLDEGTACMLVGPTGVGKTSVATLYVHAAAMRGERAAVFCFDERPETFFQRSEGLGMDLRPLVERGLISIRAVETAQLSPGEFAQLVRDAVERDGAKVVMIDSLTGYFHAMPQEDALLTQMHDLLAYLSQRRVLSLLIVGQHGMFGGEIRGPIEVSYLADTVILLRHYEVGSRVQKAISVLKKRQGRHELQIRKLELAPGRIGIGEPVEDVSGVLSGRPVHRGGGDEAADRAE